MKYKNKGFTLIELMVVVTIIAVLALSVFYLLDPLELIRRTKDTANISSAKEFAKVIAIFHTNNSDSLFPWNVESGKTHFLTKNLGKTFVYDPILSSTDLSWAYSMVESGDLNERVYQKIYRKNNLSVFYEGDEASDVLVCFIPVSKQKIKEASEDCRADNPIAPKRIRNINPCDTNDGSIPDKEFGQRNLFCVSS